MLALSADTQQLPGVGEVVAHNLALLGIHTLGDLLYNVPFRYDDVSQRPLLSEVTDGQQVTVQATVKSITQVRTRRGQSMVKAVIQDESGKLDVSWFNQPFMLYMLRPGTLRAFSGKITTYREKLSFINPVVEEIKPPDESLHTGRLVPIYSESPKLHSRTLRALIYRALNYTEILEPYTNTFLAEHQLLSLPEALRALHFPSSLEVVKLGRRRLAFDEIFGLLRTAQQLQEARKLKKARQKIHITPALQHEFQKLLPFTLSPSQTQALLDVSLDFMQTYPADRLIQGEVGSGKTVIAAFAAFCAAKNNAESLLLAPTQILARQHWQTLQDILQPTGIPVQLLVSGSTSKEKQLGTIYVGTQAAFQKKHHLEPSVVIVDEEHRFGVDQRETFLRGRKLPHHLTMTATPIPRTAAQTVLADKDVTVLDEVPDKKKHITTRVVPETKRTRAYAWMDQQISKGNQVFVVCPFIDLSVKETLQNVKAAEQEYTELQQHFPNRKLALLHGRTESSARERTLHAFSTGGLDMLVSTPIVEVGIDIPKATVMVIESAERFGLAQLHQLRGRVGRRGQAAYCLLFTTHVDAVARLKKLETIESGNELAELDLHLRGGGELFGTQQSGWQGLRYASWFDHTLIQECRQALQSAHSRAA